MRPLHHSSNSPARVSWLFAMACVLAVLRTSVIYAETPADLAQLLPNDMNAIAILRVAEALQSPRAIKENWAQIADENFMNGAGGIPSWVKISVTGFLVRPNIPAEVWSASVATVPDAVTIRSIAERNQMTTEKFGDYEVTRSRHGAYVIGLSPGMLGVWRPAVRQEASRWTRSIKAKVTGPLSDYLTQAAADPGQIVMAIDLENMLDPVNTSMHLQMMPELKESAAEVARMQKLLQGLKGATLTATTKDKTTAQIRIDFGSEVGDLAGPVQSFVLGVLHQLGAGIDELEQSKFVAEGKSLVTTTDLSNESLRRILSLVTYSPSSNTMPSTEPVAETDPPRSTGPTAEASARYLRQVDGFVNDLARASRRSNDYSRTALWHDKFASRIEEIPIEGVDPLLVDYASDVASKLRALGRSLRGQQLDVNLKNQTLTFNYDYNPGWAAMNVWGGIGAGAPSVNVTSNLQQVREQQAAAISAGARKRDEVWGMMTDDRAQVVRQMQQKYGSSFKS